VTPGRLLTWTILLGAATTSSCSSPLESTDGVARGQELFRSRALSTSHINLYTCATCHDATQATSEQIKAGAVLAGATLRPSFWGGQINDLLAAIDECRTNFMGASVPLAPGESDAVALYQYLTSLEPGNPEPVPFTTLRIIDDPLERGDAVNGAVLYDRACGYCHGRISTATGRLGERVPLLPEQGVAEHEGYTPRLLRLVFIEKVRHGRFFGYGGDMPPFSLEVLSDAELADILEALGLTGE
jgi:thiosulfate dehydrogenase